VRGVRQERKSCRVGGCTASRRCVGQLQECLLYYSRCCIRTLIPLLLLILRLVLYCCVPACLLRACVPACLLMQGIYGAFGSHKWEAQEKISTEQVHGCRVPGAGCRGWRV